VAEGMRILAASNCYISSESYSSFLRVENSTLYVELQIVEVASACEFSVPSSVIVEMLSLELVSVLSNYLSYLP
jgi:hypothetical protein